jgi:arylsulfatase
MTRNIADEGVAFIEDHDDPEQPFFLYLAFTAPHWALHALAEDVAKYRGEYQGGWDELRAARLERMKAIGLADDSWVLTPRDAQDFSDLTPEKADEMDHRMAIYAAQIDAMDQGIGRVMAALDARGALDDTLIVFLSDNGGNHEGGELGSDDPAHLGTQWGYQPGQTGIFSYGRAWGNASNTPFRRYKSDVHEGGIATPAIAHWPAGISRAGEFERSFVGHIMDFMPTFLEVAQGTSPRAIDGKLKLPPEGTSLVPTFAQAGLERGQTLFFEHEDNRAVIADEWKLVSLPAGSWELYDLSQDRSELVDVAAAQPDRVSSMALLYDAWAERTFVTKKATYDTSPRLELTEPEIGASVEAGGTLGIEWGVMWSDETDVTLEIDSGAGFQPVVAGTGSASWVVPATAAGSVLIRVSTAGGALSAERTVTIEP